MTFIEAVNRIFRLNGLIRGDTDPITSFTQTQHNASMTVAKIAVQDELIDLVSSRMIDYERTSGTLTMVAGTRVYDLPTDFRSFEFPWFRNSSTRYLYEYPVPNERWRPCVLVLGVHDCKAGRFLALPERDGHHDLPL
jgi:hypothetical protein